MDYKLTFKWTSCLLILLVMTGCIRARQPTPIPPANAQVDTHETETAQTPPNSDPYETFNRAMYKFNDGLDRILLRPVAKGYQKVVPATARKGVTNFFANIDVLTTIPNDLLQGKTAYFVADTWRLLINSTLGIGGLFDIATRFGLPKHHEDFGLTLAYWSGDDGLKPQPYLMLPFLGPATTRDALGKIPNTLTWPFHYIQPQYYNVGAIALDVVNKREQLLAADQLIQDAFDPYVFVRSAYLQSRQRAIEKNLHETNFAPYTTESQHDHAELPLDDSLDDQPDELPADFDELDANTP